LIKPGRERTVPLYEYNASRMNGRTVKGRLQARNFADLRKLLEDEGLYLFEYKGATDRQNVKPLKPKQLSEFCRDLGMMIGAGISLIRALNIMVQRDVHPRLKKSYIRLHQSLQRGLMLSEAMEEQGGIFPELLINMYKASEASGGMEDTSRKMAVHYEKSYKLTQKIRSAMVYPIILIIVTLTVLMAVFLLILPKFFTLFDMVNTPIPAITQFMINISKGLQSNWMYVLIFILVIIAGFRALKQIPSVRRGLDRFKLRIPKAGRLLRTIYTARFARTLCSCYSSGISIISALENTRETMGNKYIASQFGQLITDIRNGESLSAAIGRVDGLDRKLAASVMIGEETGRLDMMLEDTADAFDFEADIALERLTAIVEPVMIVLMAVIIGSIMISVILPLPTIYNAVGTQGGM